MTPQKQYDPIEEDSNKQDVRSKKKRKKQDITLRKGSTSRSRRRTSSTLADGYMWRKYGQKVTRGHKHPRCYYRCTHKFDQGCNASRRVQRSDEDPLIYDISYSGVHSCAPPGSLLQWPEQQLSSAPLALGIKAAEGSVAASGSSSLGSSSQITYQTPTSDGKQNMQEDNWMDDTASSDNASMDNYSSDNASLGYASSDNTSSWFDLSFAKTSHIGE